MTGIVVDTSALVCVLLREPEALVYADAMTREQVCVASTATLLEAFSVVTRRRIPDGFERMAGLVADLGIETAPFDAHQLEAAIKAYRLYGRGTGHGAGLNLGDCFSYALARTRDLPLLFKGDDFVHTDITPAIAMR